MSRAIATVELVEDDDGTVTARVKAHVAVAELSASERRAALEALTDALSQDPVDLDEEFAPEAWEQSWSDEIARRTRDIDEGRANYVSEDEAMRHMFRRARDSAR